MSVKNYNFGNGTINVTNKGDIVNNFNSTSDINYDKLLEDLQQLLDKNESNKIISSSEKYVIQDAINYTKKKDKQGLKRALKSMGKKIFDIAEKLSLNVLSTYITRYL